MLNKCDYIVLDFETGGLDSSFHEVLQIGAKAYDHRTLEPYPVESGGEFMSYMKPRYFDRLDKKAMSVNKIPLHKLEKAPDPKVVWNRFIDWVAKYNTGKSKGVTTAPIVAGKHVKFDLGFVKELNVLYSKKKEKTVLFNPKRMVDLEDLVFFWFEGSSRLERMGMDYLREQFGITLEGAHDALVDVQQEGELIMRFLKLHRRLLNMKASSGKPFIPFFANQS